MSQHDREGTPPPADVPYPSAARPAPVLPWMRLVAVLAGIALAVVVVVSTLVLSGPPSRQDLLRQAGLVGKRELLIGVKDDQPGTGLRDSVTGAFTGFDIDIALMVAADLGFRPTEVRFVSIESEDRAKMQARTGENTFVTVDLVVATYSITDEREQARGVTFSAPYLETEQSVITRTDYTGPVDTLADLRGRKVCSLSTATSESAATRAGVTVVGKKLIRECVEGLLAGEFEAVTTDAAILAGFVRLHPDQLRHHDIGLDVKEEYGINTGDNEALRDLVNLSLYDSWADPRDRRWEDAYDRHLRPAQQASPRQQVAVAQQPKVDRVEVRRWPWERAGLPPANLTAG